MNLEKEFKLLGKIRSRKERKAKILEIFRSISCGILPPKRGESIHLVRRNNRGELSNLSIRPINEDWTYFWIERDTWSKQNVWVGPGTMKDILKNIRTMGFSPDRGKLSYEWNNENLRGRVAKLSGKENVIRGFLRKGFSRLAIARMLHVHTFSLLLWRFKKCEIF